MFKQAHMRYFNFYKREFKSKNHYKQFRKKFFFNRYYIMKLFKQELNITILDYINNLRIYNSILQIKDQNCPMLHIAFKNGFYSLEYFSETFKKITGTNPSKFKSFFKNNTTLTNKEINQINKVMVNLYEISKIKGNHLSKQKPTIPPTKKLSIFK